MSSDHRDRRTIRIFFYIHNVEDFGPSLAVSKHEANKQGFIFIRRWPVINLATFYSRVFILDFT